MRTPKPKKKNIRRPSTKKTTRSTAKRSPSNPFPGIPSVSELDAQPVIVSNDPCTTNIAGQINPFRVPRGVISGLKKARPSQKFTARALASFTIPANEVGFITVAPCICSDSTMASARAFSGTLTNLNNQVRSLTTLASGVTIQAHAVSNTPYPFATLKGKDFSWRCVSTGARVRNTTAAVNRQGIAQQFFDHNHTLVTYTDDFSIGQLVIAMGSNHRTVRKNLVSHPEMELVMGDSTYAYADWQEIASSSALPETSTSAFAYTNQCQLVSSVVTGVGAGYFVLPQTAVAQSYDIEIIEHWEICGTTIETLHTPSSSHAQAEELLGNVMKQAHHQQALTPSMALHDVAKGVVYAEHHKAALKQAGEVAAALALL